MKSAFLRAAAASSVAAALAVWFVHRRDDQRVRTTDMLRATFDAGWAAAREVDRARAVADAQLRDAPVITLVRDALERTQELMNETGSNAPGDPDRDDRLPPLDWWEREWPERDQINDDR